MLYCIWMVVSFSLDMRTIIGSAIISLIVSWTLVKKEVSVLFAFSVMKAELCGVESGWKSHRHCTDFWLPEKIKLYYQFVGQKGKAFGLCYKKRFCDILSINMISFIIRACILADNQRFTFLVFLSWIWQTTPICRLYTGVLKTCRKCNSLEFFSLETFFGWPVIKVHKAERILGSTSRSQPTSQSISKSSSLRIHKESSLSKVPWLRCSS